MMAQHTENYQNLGAVRRPNFAMQEINFVEIYGNNMANILTIVFSQ
jgi:hypothetical protein